MEKQLRVDDWKKKKVVLDIPELPFGVTEAINVLRGNIQLSGYDLKVISITSALAHEGKSSIAFRLAKSMAGLKKKTLYLDCDIRNSMTLSRYKVQGKVQGLTEFLCGSILMGDIVYGTEDPFLDVIFTGPIAPNPSELLSGPLFTRMLAQLRADYDYVIVDTAPLNAVIDGALVAKQCDGTILVVESGITERSQLVHANKQLEYAGVKVLGAVLNKVNTKRDGYGYGYGYGRGYGYGYGYGQEKDEKPVKKQKTDKKAGKKS